MMMFPVVETIVYITAGLTLEPGDFIMMGTPSGVGHARKPPLWMKGGDVVEVEIDQIGVLRNVVQDEISAGGLLLPSQSQSRPKGSHVSAM